MPPFWVSIARKGYLGVMPWDGFPRTVDGRRRTPEQILKEEVVPRAVAVYVNLRSGTAYAAVPGDDGRVHACFFLSDSEDDGGEEYVLFKAMSVDESPNRWPFAVAKEITSW